MVTTPTVWKAQYRIKDGDFEFDAGYSPVFADIGLGQYVSIWSRFDGVPARFRDAEGNPVGDEFLVNQSSELFFYAPTVASRPGGGFLALYDLLNSGQHSFLVEIFDVDGTHIGSETIIEDDPNVGVSPATAVGDDGSYLVTYSRKNPDSTWDIVAKFVDASGTPDAEVTIFDSGDTQETSSVVARLSDDNYVVVYRNFFGSGDYDLEYRFVGFDGTPGSGGQVVASFDDEADMKVAALTGGGFVVVWTDDDEDDNGPGTDPGIRYSVYANNGGPIKAPSSVVDGGFAVNATSAGNQINPDVIGLKDGGFVVVWQDEQRDGVYGQRFDAAGNTVGSEFLAGSGTASIGVPTSVALLGDGRFIVGFTEYFNNNYGYAYATIFDPRDSVINGDGNNNVITSRIDGATVNGLGGADTLLGQGGPDTLNGGSGVDTMRGRGGDDTYIVDEQGDFPVESFNQGTDHVFSRVSYSLVDNVENLTLNGAAVSGGGNGIANVLTGNDGLNRLDGFDGNDTLIGKGGSDFLFGGNNDDTLLGEGESDDLEGNGGNDALDGGSGSDRMNGGAGIDTLTGGAGPDTFVFDASVTAKTIAAAADNADIVTDFNPADDTIELAASVFPKLKVGVLKNKAFDSGKKKPAKDKHPVYYDEKNGGLWYDANGKKQKGKGDVLIATLDPGLDLKAGDIVVA